LSNAPIGSQKATSARCWRIFLTTGGWPQILVFTRTKHGANRLAEQLSRDGIKTDAIHGNKSQSARTQALAGFKRGMVRALIATDIAARGLDIAQLPLVVNFELPHVAQDYIHRIGRTGRAGSAGLAVSLICPEEQKLLTNIERVINRRLTIAKPSDFQPGKPTVTARLLKAKAGGWPTGSSTRHSTGATSTPFPGSAGAQALAVHAVRRGKHVKVRQLSDKEFV
jgi:ATP-dependent RNA helicase RhlE